MLVHNHKFSMSLTGPIFLPLENLNLCAEGFPAGCVNCVPVQKF